MKQSVLVLSFLALAPALVAQAPRRPRGIYAKVDTAGVIAQQQQINPGITPAQLEAALVALYQGLLADPAISGLTLGVHWDTVNPNAPPAANAYQWNYLDDGFAQVAAWNVQNPTQPAKTIQLIVIPGFDSPAWVFNQIPSCDGFFQTPSQTPPSNCGTATFTGYPEGADGTVLPLPWNPVYKSAWKTFLTALSARYGSNPALVSIPVAGPTAASEEMLLPNDGSSPPQTQFGGIMPNAMWRQLLAFQYPNMPAYQNSDQAFIDEWDAAIDMYGQIFSGLTLVATTGSGLPSFNQNFTVPAGFAMDCTNPNMDCAAETTILSHFVDPTVGGPNAKATQTGGLAASRAGFADLGPAGVKWLAQSTANSSQILGGEQFDHPFSTDTLFEGCTSSFPPNSSDTPAGCTIPPTCTTEGCLPVACIPQACLAPGVTQASLAGYSKFSQVPAADLIPPEQALYNVLNFFFNGTAVASSFGGTPGATPLNFLQAIDKDVLYAQANANAPAQVVEAGGTVSVSAQDLFNLASQKLLQIAEPPAFFAREVSLGSGVDYLQFPDGNVFGYYNLTNFPIFYHYDLGFEAFVDGGNGGAYMYDFAAGHWFYTSSSLFPYLYDFTLNAWLFYFPNTAEPGHYTTNPRYFSNLSTGKIITM